MTCTLPTPKPLTLAHVDAAPDTPRVYVACLASYNEGWLHGEWLDATSDTLAHDIQTHVLATSPIPGAEEWAIHDFDGFGAYTVSEYANLTMVVAIAQGIQQHGPQFAAWVTQQGCTQVDELEEFEDRYAGWFPTVEDWAEVEADADWIHHVVTKELGETLARYVRFDAEQYAYDAQIGGDITTCDATDGGVWVYRTY